MADMKAVCVPCDIGDIVYVLCEGLRIPGRRRVTDIHISGSGTDVTVKNDRTGEVDRYPAWKFGDKIFTNLIAAEEAVQKIRDNK